MPDPADAFDPESHVAPNSCAAATGASEAGDRDGAIVSAATVPAAASLLLAVWCAAGSLGLIAHPLRLAVTYLSLIVAAAAIWPRRELRRWWSLSLVVLSLIALRAATSASGSLELLVATGAAAWLAATSSGRQRAVLQTCALAILAFTVFRLACSSVSAVWLFANSVGELIGRCAGALFDLRLNVGATFAGVDFLVLMAAWYVGWLLATGEPRRWRGLAAAGAILGVHLLYLAVVAYALKLAALLPAVPKPTFDHPYVPPPWSWPDAVRQLLPWNLPALAAVLHLAIASIMLRWSSWRTDREGSAQLAGPSDAPRSAWRRRLLASSPYLLAVLLPVSAALSPSRSDLSGKRFVANQAGNLDWDLPQHDRYGQAAAGQFGMLPHLIASLGGELRLSPDFSARDLSQADVVLVLQPAGPLAESCQQRLREFVHNGGSLLVVAEPYQQQGGLRSGSDDLLTDTAIRVRRDVAISEAGGWQHSCDLLFHGATYGIGTQHGACFTDTGASLWVGWPARPIVLGRWGWSDPGSDAVLTGVSRFEAGERLGDLVLAAEQQVGAGLVAVLGDAYPFTNEGGVRGSEYTGRLLSHLAHRSGSPQTPWRQAVTSLVALGLLGAAFWRPAATRVLGVVVLWALSQAGSEAISRRATRVVPDGRLVNLEGPTSASRLAYIDAAHLSPYSDGPWDFDGINGLTLTLMRNGYLTLTLPELSRERLERAAVFVSIAPARQFTEAERQVLRAFVESGGTFFCLVGAEEAFASDAWLADFGLHVPPSPVPTLGRWREPEPLGHVSAAYGNAKQHGAGDYQASVQFYAAWPVTVDANHVEILVSAPHGQPVVVSRQVGQGRVVVIGDTGFALNKNLEYVGGEPFDGRYDNAHFWRWLISRVTSRAEWSPPPPPPLETAAASQEAQP